MNLQTFFDSPLVQNLGWTLLHSFWQIVLIAVLLWLGLKISARATANFRHNLACAAMFLALIVPIGSFGWLANSAEETVSGFKSQVSSENLEAERLKLKDGKFESTGISTKSQNQSSEIQTWSLKLEAWNLNAFLPHLVWLWLFGILLFTVRTIGGAWRLRAMRRTKIKAVSDELQRRFLDLCEKVGVSTQVKIFESALVSAPVVVGWLKPIILIPASALTGLAPAQLETVIVHELIHIRRLDFMVNLVQTFVEIVLFYHPCAWWISNQIRSEREFATDDAVVAFYGNERLNYAHALANLEKIRGLATAQTNPQLSLAANGGKLMNRIKRIVNSNENLRNSWTSPLAASLALVVIAAIFAGFMTAGNNFAVNAGNASIKGKTRKIAVGFVSIPPVDRSDNAPHDAVATAQILIEKLKSHRVPAIGFVNGSQISDGEKLFPVRAEIVRTWRDAGLEVGIGNFKHIWFYDTPYDEFVAGVEKNERVTKQILAEKNLPLHYFSYPYLNTGKTTEDKNRFENWLNSRGLKSVKYTIDNSEWIYSYAYDMARKDNDIATMKEIRADFLAYMGKMFDHYEAYSEEMFNRQIAQTMVLTPSRLVADTGDELFGMIEKRGYTWVSMDEAQADEAYKTPETFTGVKAGISWFERWTLTRGLKLREEPKVSESVEKVWNERDKK